MAQRQRIRPGRAELTDDLEAALEAYQSAPAAKLYRGPPSAHFKAPSVPTIPSPSAPSLSQEEPSSSSIPKTSAKGAAARPQSKFKQAMAQKREAAAAAGGTAGANAAHTQSASALSLVGEIKERPQDAKPVQAPTLSDQQEHSHSSGFPQPTRLSTHSAATSASLADGTEQLSTRNPIQGSTVLSDDPVEVMAQRDANQMFAAMSEEEILREQEELLDMLGPDAVAFFKNRKGHNSATQQPASAGVNSNIVEEDTPVSDAAEVGIHPVASTSKTADEVSFDAAGGKHESGHQSHTHDVSAPRSIDDWLVQTRSAVSQQRAKALSALSLIVQRHWMDPAVKPAHLKLLSCATTCLAANTHQTVLAKAVQLLQSVQQTAARFSDAQGPERLQELLVTLEQQEGLTPLNALSKVLMPRTSSLPWASRATLARFVHFFTSSVRAPEAKLTIRDHPRLLPSLVQHAFNINWPVTASNMDPSALDSTIWPDLTAIDILMDFSAQREDLEVVLHLRPIELLARFVALPFWTLEEAQTRELGRLTTAKTMDLLSMWAVYGLGSELRSSLAPLWSAFEMHAWQPEEAEAARAWFRLMTSWATAAYSPHETSPEHSILWSQVEGWREPLSDAQSILSGWNSSQSSALAAQTELMLALSQFEQNRIKWNPNSTPIPLPSFTLDIVPVCTSFVQHPTSTGAQWILALLELSSAYSLAQIRANLKRLVNALFAATRDQADACGRVTVPLLLELSMLSDFKFQVTHYLEVAALCDPTEVKCFSTLLPTLIDGLFAGRDQDRLKVVLSPLFSQSSGAAPFLPTSDTLKSTQSIPTQRQKPIGPTWILRLPLDELFDSATSHILRKLPKEYDFGELDMVTAALELQLAALHAAGRSSCPIAVPGRRTFAFELMRVFMLEKDQRPTFSPSGATALFREARAAQLLREAMRVLARLDEDEPWPMESAAFYAFFGDFLALFEAASFRDHTFSELILLVVSDPTLPADFRTLLFSEHSGILPLLAADEAAALLWSSISSSSSSSTPHAFQNDPLPLKKMYRAQLERIGSDGQQAGLATVCRALLQEDHLG